MAAPSTPSPAADAIDKHLAAQPVSASPGFAEGLFARIETEAVAADPALDPLLARLPVRATPGFTAGVMDAIGRERRRRQVLRFAVPPALAACLAVAAVTLFHRPADPDIRIARLLAADHELSALVAMPSASHATAFEADLASLDELGSVAGDSRDAMLES